MGSLRDSKPFQLTKTVCANQPGHVGLAKLGESGAATLARQGYMPFGPLLNPAFADRMPEEVDQLIAEGYFTTPADRVVNGRPTEVLLSLGRVTGQGPDTPVFQRSAFIRGLWAALEEFGRDFNRMRPALLRSGAVTPEEAPELAVEGMEWNMNRVVTPWSGLHPHQDQHRFTPGAMRLSDKTIRHALQRARILTVSGYARTKGADGSPRNDLGGALTVFVRRNARNQDDKAIHDVVPANHNTGAAFFAHTMHGVARMTAEEGLRYSFQAFYPAKAAWEQIEKRIASGELDRELEAVRKAAANDSRAQG